MKLDDLIKAVRSVAADNPEFVYESPDGGDCLYAHQGAPSCLVGHALHKLGVSVQELSEYEGHTVGHVLDDVISEPDWEWAFSAWLQVVQDLQDSGFSWAAAVERADHVYSRVAK